MKQRHTIDLEVDTYRQIERLRLRMPGASWNDALERAILAGVPVACRNADRGARGIRLEWHPSALPLSGLEEFDAIVAVLMAPLVAATLEPDPFVRVSEGGAGEQLEALRAAVLEVLPRLRELRELLERSRKEEPG